MDSHYCSSSWNNITIQLHPSSTLLLPNSVASDELCNKHSLHSLCKVSSEAAVPKHNLEFKCGLSYLCFVLLDSLLIRSWNHLNLLMSTPNNGERGSFCTTWYWIHLHKIDGPRGLLCFTVGWNVLYIQQLFPYVIPYMLRHHYMELSVMNIR
jgi:hypothetical protein